MYFNFLKIILENGELASVALNLEKNKINLIQNYIYFKRYLREELFDLDPLKTDMLVIKKRKNRGALGAFFKLGALHIEFGNEETLNSICKYCYIKPYQARVQGSQLIFEPNYLSLKIHTLVLIEEKFELNNVKELVKEFSKDHFDSLQTWLKEIYSRSNCLEAKAVRLFINLIAVLSEKTRIYDSHEVGNVLGSNPPSSCLDQLSLLSCYPFFLSSIVKFDYNFKVGPVEAFLNKFKELSTEAPRLQLFNANHHEHIKDEILNLAKTYSDNEECASRLESTLAKFNYLLRFHPWLRGRLGNFFEQMHNLILDKTFHHSIQTHFFDKANANSKITFSKDFLMDEIVQKMIGCIESIQDYYLYNYSRLLVTSLNSNNKRNLDDNSDDKSTYKSFKKI